MDKKAKYIFEKYIEAANLLNKKGGWLGQILMGLNPVTLPFAALNLATSAVQYGIDKLMGYDKNFEASISSIIDKLNWTKSSGSNWNSTVDNINSKLSNNLKKISVKNINTNIKTEEDLKKAAKQFFVIKNSINEITKTLDYILSDEVKKTYEAESKGVLQTYLSYTSAVGDVFDQIKKYAVDAKKQAAEYTASLDQIINKVKEQYINAEKTKEDTKDTDTDKKVEEFLADVKR